MKIEFRKIIFALIIFSFAWFFVASVSLAVDSPLSTQPTSQGISYEEVNSLKDEVEKLRSENYQRVLESSQNTIDKINQYTDGLTLLATVFGFFLTGFGIFFGINFYFAKKEFSEQLREIKTYVTSARQNAELVKGYANDAKKQTESLPQIIEGIQKNREEMVQQLLTKAKRTNNKKVKEFDEALTRIQENASKLNQKLLQTINNIQSANSQASAISGSVSFSPSVSPSPSYPPFVSPFVTEAERCSKCGKVLTALDGYISLSGEFTSGGLNIGEKLCFDCKTKENSKPPE